MNGSKHKTTAMRWDRISNKQLGPHHSVKEWKQIRGSYKKVRHQGNKALRSVTKRMIKRGIYDLPVSKYVRNH